MARMQLDSPKLISNVELVQSKSPMKTRSSQVPVSQSVSWHGPLLLKISVDTRALRRRPSLLRIMQTFFPWATSPLPRSMAEIERVLLITINSASGHLTNVESTGHQPIMHADLQASVSFLTTRMPSRPLTRKGVLISEPQICRATALQMMIAATLLLKTKRLTNISKRLSMA